MLFFFAPATTDRKMQVLKHRSGNTGLKIKEIVEENVENADGNGVVRHCNIFLLLILRTQTLHVETK